MIKMVGETETLTDELFNKIQDLYDQGLYLQAFENSKQVGPIEKWTGNRSRVLGARIANHVGSTRLGRVLLRLAHRHCPTDPEINYFHTFAMLGRRGAYKTFEVINQLGELEGADEVTKSDWFAMQGLLYAYLRDFENADKWIERAFEIAPDRAWLHVQHSSIFDLQDRPKDAAAAAEHALKLQPWFRPAVQSLANRMVQEHRDEEAISLLRSAIEKIESGDLRIQLATLFLELERYDEANKLFSNLTQYFPMLKMEPKVLESLSALNADLQYYCGNHVEAVEHAKKANSEFFTDMAKRLSDPEFEGKRVRLPVKFFRQDHLTCAPATLTSIAELLEQVCRANRYS